MIVPLVSPRARLAHTHKPACRTAGWAALLLAAGIGLAACGGERGRKPEGGREARIVTARAQGLALLQQDRLDEAEAQFRKLTDLAPEEPTGYANLALVYLRRGELVEAERWAKEALDRAPEDPDLRLILARVEEDSGRRVEARQDLERALAADPEHLKVLYALAEWEGPEAAGGEKATAARRRDYLRRIVRQAPGNLAARLQLISSLLQAGEADSAAAQLEEVRSVAPELPEGAAEEFRRALARARAGDARGARAPFSRFRELVATTGPYQAALQQVEGPRGEASGFLNLAFSYSLTLQVPVEKDVLEALRFADGTTFAGLDVVAEGAGSSVGGTPRGGTRVAAGDADGDGDADLFVWTAAAPPGLGRGFLLRNDLGRFVDTSPPVFEALTAVTGATWGDYDGDGREDLYIVRDGPNRLFRNQGDGRLEDVSEAAGVADPGSGRAALFVDADLDGDVDLLIVNRASIRLYRNNLDGTFTERSRAMGLGGSAPGSSPAGARLSGPAPGSAAAFADFDDDVDVDLLLARGSAGAALYRNDRQARFTEVSEQVGLGGGGSARAVAIGDYDNDGLTDILIAGLDSVRLFRNQPGGTFRRDRGSDQIFAGAHPIDVADAAFLDFDNDGHLDLAVAGRFRNGESPGLRLFRNKGDGRFEDLSAKLPAGTGPASALEVFDYNEDGDLDLLVGLRAGGVRLLRNDGGNVNHHVDIRLMGRGAGSGKVNRFGIGSTLQLRAGDLLQSRVATGPVVHFGLGHRLKADVLQVVWTNGVPQDLYWPGTDQDLIESKALKGSCAFIYGWDGKRHVFIKDAMWKSALGMPVGIMAASRPGDSLRVPAVAGSTRVYATPAASREYVRIPGRLLKPVDGTYRLQLTEELWEVAYVDEVKLLAVDHPDSVELYADERFVPPAPPELRLYTVSRELPPVGATDAEGNDLLPALRALDDRYVSNLTPGRYQGTTRMHDLILDLGAEAVEAATRTEPLALFLRGWIFPTDASINVSIEQSKAVKVVAPYLQVPDGQGGWVTAIRDLGFPAGKDKTVVVELTGILRPGDPRVRIRTNMEIYWDQAFFAVQPGVARLGGRPEAVAARLRAASVLSPARAELRYRGFSREYRKGGRYGPQWFDYEDVSPERRWRSIQGPFTRYGDVTALLEDSDDMYAILAPGDGMTLEFEPAEAGGPGELPPGWTRTFLLYTDGWIKDADLNTATGNQVAPLPFHAQSHYPYGSEVTFPDDAAHRRWRERYNTRAIPAEKR